MSLDPPSTSLPLKACCVSRKLLEFSFHFQHRSEEKITNSSQQTTALSYPTMSTTNPSICMICSQDKSKNPVAMEPGCCGKWLHLDCLKLILNAGGTKCPSCSVDLPQSLMIFGGPQPQPQPVAQPIHAYPVAEAIPMAQNAPPPLPAPAFNNPLSPQLPKGPGAVQGPTLNRPMRTHHLSGGALDSRTVAKNPEDPIEPWTPVVLADSDLKSVEDYSTAPSIATHCIPEVPELTPGPRGNFSAVVNLAASANVRNADVRMETRPPMDIVCVLDVSGSMGSDYKLVNLKHAVDYIRSELTENDRLSVITFNSSAGLTHNLLRMNEGRKAQSLRETSQLRASGGTSILAGLQSAYSVLSSRQQANPITSVFLLTDGIDASNLPEKQRTAQMLKEMGSSLFVFGFGNDHDSAHLQAIADAADGMFTFIERSDMVIDAFGGVLGAEQSIFATNIELHIRALHGTSITQVESGMYVNQISSDGSSAVIRYKNLMFGEERDILILMNVAASGEINDGQVLFSTFVTYRPLSLSQTAPSLEAQGGDCVVKRLNMLTEAAMVRNIIVDVQINRLILTRATKQSMDFADSGNYAQARSVLQDAINTLSTSSSRGDIKTQAFLQELQLALNDVRSETEFRSGGGRSNMSEKAQNYSRQRMCYAKAASPAVYQNDYSSAQQAKASKSKR